MSTLSGGSLRSRISELPPQVAPGLVVCATVFAALWLAYGPPGWGIERVTGLVASAAILPLALNWRRGVFIVVAYVTIEGVVTNLLYPAVLPLFIKDAFVAIAYVGFLGSVIVERERWLVPSSFARPAAFLAALVAVGSLNPSGVSPLVALVGARVLLLYIPLYVLGFHLARRPLALRKLVRFVLLTSLPITLYGIFQYFAGPDFVAGLGEGFARTVWVVGPEALPDSIYRPASTFTFVGHFGAYLFFVVLIGFAALHAPRSWGGRALTTAAFWSAAIAVVLQSQRTTWILLPGAVVATYLLNRSPRGFLRAAPVAAVGLFLAVVVGSPVLQNRLPLLTSGGGLFADRLHVIVTTFAENVFSPHALIGHGTGTALGAARYVSGGEVPDAFESGWFSPFYMFGVWGVLAYLWLYTAVLRAAWRGVAAFPAFERWVPTVLFCYLLLTAAVSGPVNYPPTNIYFWLFAGLLAGSADTAASAAAEGAGGPAGLEAEEPRGNRRLMRST